MKFAFDKVWERLVKLDYNWFPLTVMLRLGVFCVLCAATINDAGMTTVNIAFAAMAAWYFSRYTIFYVFDFVYWRHKCWYYGVEDMQFYFEGHDNRLTEFMQYVQEKYPEMYDVFLDDKYYNMPTISEELCKYLIARVDALTDCRENHNKLFVAACYKDTSMGTQEGDPQRRVLTHVILAYSLYDSKYEVPIIIDPLYGKYMPEIRDPLTDDALNVTVVTDLDQVEEVYDIKKVYDVIGLMTITTKPGAKNPVALYQADDSLEAIPYSSIRAHITKLDEEDDGELEDYGVV